MLLHFGAIDWQSSIYLNGKQLGNHTGGYDGFSFDITDGVTPTGNGNELLVYAHDPSELGVQPSGKQQISSISGPGGDKYTPSSGIWQTVWLEAVPTEYVADIHIDQASLTGVIVTVWIAGTGLGQGEGLGRGLPTVTVETVVKCSVMDATGKVVATGSGTATGPPDAGTGLVNVTMTITVPAAKLWSPTNP
jgi:beta-galactosidase/beta-glucuronidase